jgi:isopenicillin-N epimerase
MTEFVSRRTLIAALGAGTLAPAAVGAQGFYSGTPPPASTELWNWTRAQLVLDPQAVWLDTASFGPTLRAAMVTEYRRLEQRSQSFRRYQQQALSADALRRMLTRAATFLGTQPDDLAFTTGSTDALNLVARGIDLAPGDEVLTTTHDHPAAVYPWLMEARRRGIKVVQLPQRGVNANPSEIVGRFAAAVSPRTRVVSIAHVQYTDGTVMPVREICTLARQNGALSIVDGAQAPGMLDFRIDQLGCDCYATSFHKWVSAPYGTGALYVRREARARIWPLVVERPAGWDSTDRFGTTPLPLQEARSGWPETQARFGQMSRLSGPTLESVEVALDFQRAVSPARVSARIRDLAMYLRLKLGAISGVQVLSPTHASLSSGIVSIAATGRNHGEIAESMARDDGIFVAHVAHGDAFDALRASVHAHNTHAELERFVAALQRRL